MDKREVPQDLQVQADSADIAVRLVDHLVLLAQADLVDGADGVVLLVEQAAQVDTVDKPV